METMPQAKRQEPTQLTTRIQNHLEESRKNQGLSQRALEDNAGVSQSRIAQTLGKNTKALDLVEFEKICTALRLDIEKVISDASRSTTLPSLTPDGEEFRPDLYQDHKHIYEKYGDQWE